MAITNRTTLISAIITHAFRAGDTEFEAAAPDFITAAEQGFNYGFGEIGPLRVSDMEDTSVGTLVDGAAALPDDFLELRSVKADSSPNVSLQPMSPQFAVDEYASSSSTGYPVGYYISGGAIYTVPVSTSDLIIDYYAVIPPLSDAEPTNWLLTNHPDCYLSACMVEAGIFAEDERASSWEQRLRSAIDSIAWVDARSISVGTLSVDPALRAPGRFDFATGRTWP
jgi:hypothetical protein